METATSLLLSAVIAAAGVAGPRAQAVEEAAREKERLAQTLAELADPRCDAAVRDIFGPGEADLAARYLRRRPELLARAAAARAELDKALTLTDDAAAKAALEAASRKAQALRDDAQAWRVLPLSIADIDSGKEPAFAELRPVGVTAMRLIAVTGDYESARRTVLEAVKALFKRKK